jgi:hypothetical protein
LSDFRELSLWKCTGRKKKEKKEEEQRKKKTDLLGYYNKALN